MKQSTWENDTTSATDVRCIRCGCKLGSSYTYLYCTDINFDYPLGVNGPLCYSCACKNKEKTNDSES